ncbi:MAG: phosphomethylpyrimidine kinase, partial [Oscillospiraceae bacterium]
GAFWLCACNYVPVSYPGTGDLFAAVLTGGLLWGDSLPIALNRATFFTESAVKTTYGYGSDTRDGVMLEKILGNLTHHDIFSSYEIL